MTLAARAYIAAVIALGALALGQGLAGWTPRDIPRLLGYLLMAAAASGFKMKLPHVLGTVSMSFLFVFLGIVDLGCAEALLIGTASVLVQSLWHARFRPRAVQVLFSAADLWLAVTVGSAVYSHQWLHGAPPDNLLRLGSLAAVYFVANCAPIAGVIALTEHKPVLQVWREGFGWSFAHYLVGAALVGLFQALNRAAGWEAWLLVLPIVYVSYKSYRMYFDQLEAGLKKAEEQRQHAEELAVLHRQAVEALDDARIANAKLAAVIQASPLAIFALDQSATVTSWNATAQRMFGWSEDEVLGRTLPLLRARPDDGASDLIYRALSGELLCDVEVAQRRKDGSRFDAAVWTAPTRDSGQQVVGIVAAVADVSERKLLEERVRFSAKMESVGRLAGGIAHDFNNLLTVINGYGTMLLDSLKGQQDEYASSQAREILNAGTRAADLVAKLLAFSRRQVTERRMLEINEIVRNIERMLQRLIGEHIDLKMALEPEAGWVMADPSQMEAALINLATNARDAMVRGGVLAIETKRAEVGPETRLAQPALPVGSYVAIVVRDTGEGMDAETQRHIFEPFFTTKETGRGTGLGLSSVYGAVEQNGGFVFVSSTVGEGTTFSLYLPRFEPVVAQETGAAPSTCLSAGTETVLLVEDEAPVRRMLREALSNAGYRVWESGDGADALRHWGPQVEKIDLVVTDVVMPVMSGLKLAEELRKQRTDIKVVFMSGHADEILAAQGDIHSAVNLLQKPFLPLDLVRKVRQTLDKAANLDSCNSPDA